MSATTTTTAAAPDCSDIVAKFERDAATVKANAIQALAEIHQRNLDAGCGYNNKAMYQIADILVRIGQNRDWDDARAGFGDAEDDRVLQQQKEAAA